MEEERKKETLWGVQGKIWNLWVRGRRPSWVCVRGWKLSPRRGAKLQAEPVGGREGKSIEEKRVEREKLEVVRPQAKPSWSSISVNVI